MAIPTLISNRLFLIGNDNPLLPLVYEQERIDSLISALSVNPNIPGYGEELFLKILREFDQGQQTETSPHSARASYELAKRAELARDPFYIRRVREGVAEPIDPRILTYSGLETSIREAAVQSATIDRTQSLFNFFKILSEIVANKIFFGAIANTLDEDFVLSSNFPDPFPQFPSDPLASSIPLSSDIPLDDPPLPPGDISKIRDAQGNLEATTVGMIGVRLNPVMAQVVALTIQVNFLKKIVKQLTDKIKALGG